MSNDFQQTVNLKEEMERQKEEAANRAAPDPKVKPKPKKETSPARKKFVKRSREIDEVYNGETEKIEPQKELFKITKPVIKRSNERLYKQAVLAMGAVIILEFVLFIYGN